MAGKNENDISKKQVAKKKSLLEKIFNWICLSVFLLLIVGLIVLRTPWTVVAVLVAILLVNTVVPKSIRKWIWFDKVWKAVITLGSDQCSN